MTASGSGQAGFEDSGEAVLEPLSKKRKVDDGRADHGAPHEPDRRDVNKKVKLQNDDDSCPRRQDAPSGTSVTDQSLFPPDIWHRIFIFCPPHTLGRLLQVNRLLNRYLDPSSRVQQPLPQAAAGTTLGVPEPDAVWRASRRRFWPDVPSPVRSLAELDMWRLVCSSTCQRCDKSPVAKQTGPSSRPDPDRAGPGEDGVSIVWPFAIRVCGPCLLELSVKEIDLLLSPTVPAAILPALPYVFVTQHLDVWTIAAVQKGNVPSDAQLTKLFLSSDVEELQQEFQRVKEMGPGTAEDWLKGLTHRGLQQRSEAKHELWQSALGLAGTHNGHHPGLPSSQSGQASRARLLLDPSRANLPPKPTSSAVSWSNRDVPRLQAERLEARNSYMQPEVAQDTKLEQCDLTRSLAQTLPTTKRPKDLTEEKWTEVQASLRADITRIAEDFISRSWQAGKRLTRATCSQFAVETLNHVRRRFYEDMASSQHSVGAPEGSLTRKLTLENMRWLFDTAVLPHTARFGKELFLCFVCRNQGKSYGLEGVTQHFAAKHNHALGKGTTVVRWRTEWPDPPPFTYDRQQPPGRPPFAKLQAPPTASMYTAPTPQGYAPPAAYAGVLAYMPPPQPPPQSYPGTVEYPPPGRQGVSFSSIQPSSHAVNHVAPQPVGGPGTPGHGYGLYYGNYQPPPYAPPPSRAQVEQLATTAREVWNTLITLKELPDALRVFTAIHHSAKRFHAHFDVVLPLALFNDGLSNHKEMRPIRNFASMRCRACELSLGNAATIVKDKTSFSFPQLCNHFLAKHVEPMCSMPHLPPLDWLTDMIVLPEWHTIQQVLAGLKPETPARQLVAEAFPPPPPAAMPPALNLDQALQDDTRLLLPHQLPPVYVGTGSRDDAAPVPTAYQDYKNYTQPAAITAPQHEVGQLNLAGWTKLADPPQQNVHHGNVETGRECQGSAPSRSPLPEPFRNPHSASQSVPRSAMKGQEARSSSTGKNRNRRGRNTGLTEDERRIQEEDRRRADEDRKSAEEEAKRQEQEIRNMWARDRANAARALPASKPQPQPQQQQQQNENKIRVKVLNQVAKSRVLRRQPPHQQAPSRRSKSPVHSGRPSPETRNHGLPTAEPGEPDLMGRLELHLEKSEKATLHTAPLRSGRDLASYYDGPNYDGGRAPTAKYVALDRDVVRSESLRDDGSLAAPYGGGVLGHRNAVFASAGRELPGRVPSNTRQAALNCPEHDPIGHVRWVDADSRRGPDWQYMRDARRNAGYSADNGGPPRTVGDNLRPAGFEAQDTWYDEPLPVRPEPGQPHNMRAIVAHERTVWVWVEVTNERGTYIERRPFLERDGTYEPLEPVALRGRPQHGASPAVAGRSEMAWAQSRRTLGTTPDDLSTRYYETTRVDRGDAPREEYDPRFPQIR